MATEGNNEVEFYKRDGVESTGAGGSKNGATPAAGDRRCGSMCVCRLNHPEVGGRAYKGRTVWAQVCPVIPGACGRPGMARTLILVRADGRIQACATAVPAVQLVVTPAYNETHRSQSSGTPISFATIRAAGFSLRESTKVAAATAIPASRRLKPAARGVVIVSSTVKHTTNRMVYLSGLGVSVCGPGRSWIWKIR